MKKHTKHKTKKTYKQTQRNLKTKTSKLASNTNGGIHNVNRKLCARTQTARVALDSLTLKFRASIQEEMAGYAVDHASIEGKVVADTVRRLTLGTPTHGLWTCRWISFKTYTDRLCSRNVWKQLP